jgi:hypothetical protein
MRYLTTVTALLSLAFALPLVLAQPVLPCNDQIPSDCKVVRFLGEEKGCACFDCNPGTPKATVICTRDPEKKKTLFSLVPRVSVATGPARGAER